MEEKKERRIVIVGAGLVGSLLAALLAKRGYRVDVYEKRPDLRKTALPAGRSINLALAERGIHALRQAGVMDQVEPLLIPMRGRLLHDRLGETEFQPYGQRPEEVINSVSRSGLNRVLLDAAAGYGCHLHFNQSCTSIDLRSQVLALSDHMRDIVREASFDTVLGADGVASILRDAIIEETGGQSRIDRLDHDYKELCIPAAGDGTHRIQREALHIWPRGGFMLIALPNLDGSFTVTLFLDRQGPVSFAALNQEQDVTDFFAREFPDALALIPDLVSQFFENPTGPLGTVRCDTWSHEADALILGDAAHAIVPFHGQGMNAGFEDCQILMSCLDRHDDNWQNVIGEFATKRKPDAAAIADMALENYIIMRDSVTDVRFKQKKELGFELERRFPGRFIPRYSMVMFHRIPYADALRRGQVQEEMLNRLLEEPLNTGEIDFGLAQRLIDQYLDVRS